MGGGVWSNKTKFCGVNMALITKGQVLLNPEFQYYPLVPRLPLTFLHSSCCTKSVLHLGGHLVVM